MRENRVDRFAPRLLWVPSILLLALFSWTVACGERSPLDPSPSSSGVDVAAGVTTSRSATTVPPPPLPPDGEKNHGILLAFDKPCPTCTLVTPRGTALVWFNTEIFRETGSGVVPISFDELNMALFPGQPLRMRVDNLDATQPVAQWLIVERHFATTGSIDRSSADVSSSSEFVLAVQDEIAGRVDIPYVLDADAVVEPFGVGARVYLSGVVVDGQLRVKLVRPDV